MYIGNTIVLVTIIQKTIIREKGLTWVSSKGRLWQPSVVVSQCNGSDMYFVFQNAPLSLHQRSSVALNVKRNPLLLSHASLRHCWTSGYGFHQRRRTTNLVSQPRPCCQVPPWQKQGLAPERESLQTQSGQVLNHVKIVRRCRASFDGRPAAIDTQL